MTMDRLSLEQQAFARKMADGMIARKAHERTKILTITEAESLELKCRSKGSPYYESDGQFTGGYHCARYEHPSKPGRRIQFSYTPDGDIDECVEWTQYLNYPYPL